MINIENGLKMKVEIPTGSLNKYEFDIRTKEWKLDRVLYGSMTYPADYGFIENTIDYDGDPLDVICIVSEPTFPGCIISLKILGVLEMIDEGKEDHKIIAVPSVDPRFSNIKSIEEIGHNSSVIMDFFSNYKNLENKKVLVKDFFGIERAFDIINNSRRMFINFEKEINSSDYSKSDIIKLLNKSKN
jgi:inorganic pyrophosphatase